jgi:rRNA maturation protein Rpf1
MILITTSHRPTQKVRTLIRDLSRVIPNSIRINRGKLSMNGLAEEATQLNADKVIIVERYQGNPGGILFYKVVMDKLKQVPPQIYMNDIKTQDDIGERKSIRRGLAITTIANPSMEVKQLASALSDFLGIPCLDKPMPNYQAAIHLAPDAKYKAKISLVVLPTFKEVGPVITVKHISYQSSDESQKKESHHSE